MATIRSILVPVDGSPPSIAALEHAVALAEESAATRIEVLEVDAPDAFAFGSARAVAPGAREAVRLGLEAAVERARGRLGERVTSRTIEGEPLRTIVEVASSGDHELIVMGTHGSVGRLHTILGSVAEGVIRSAPCPVLTVRESGGEYQSFADRVHDRPSLGAQVLSRPT